MKRVFKKTVAMVLALMFMCEQAGFAQAGVGNPGFYFSPGAVPSLSDKFRPVHLRYLNFIPKENRFQLLLDKGDSKNLTPAAIQGSARQVMDYFLIGLTLPNESFWVNLRPDQPQSIIDPELEKTDVGRIFLEADLNLKKDLARFTSPDTSEGKQYWDKLYAKAGELFGDGEMSLPTFTRPWIVPGEIIVRQSKESAYVYKATLKVMLAQDYLKDQSPYFEDQRLKELNDFSSALIRKLIIPRLIREVNVSKRYASLRQVYYSLILSQWFKGRYSKNEAGAPGSQDTKLSEGYVSKIDTKDLSGLTSGKPWSKMDYFSRYKQSFEKGEYNKTETIKTLYGQTIRQYVSGGIKLGQVLFTTQVMNEVPAAVRFPQLSASWAAMISMFPGADGNPVISLQEPGGNSGGTTRISPDGGTIADPISPEQENSLYEAIAKEERKYKLVEMAFQLGLDTRPVGYGLLHPLYVAYAMAARKAVNPVHDPKRVWYKGAGVGISDFLLSTDATEADFEAYYNGGLSEDILRTLSELDIISDNENRSAVTIYRDIKFESGYAGSFDAEDFRYAAMYLKAELKAMEIDIKKVRVDSDVRTTGSETVAYPRITFEWAYPGQKPKTRSISFLDISYPYQKIVYRESYDIYYQRASEELPFAYKPVDGSRSYILDVYDKLSPGGFFLTDDHAYAGVYKKFSDQGMNFPLNLAKIPILLNPRVIDGIKKIRGIQDENEVLYGCGMTVRQVPLDKPVPGAPRDGGHRGARVPDNAFARSLWSKTKVSSVPESPGIAAYVKSKGLTEWRHLATADLIPGKDLPGYYPTLVGLRMKRKTLRPPLGSLADETRIEVSFPETDTFLVSRGSNGHMGCVKLGFVNGMPVALKSNYFADTSEPDPLDTFYLDTFFLENLKDARIVDDLGIGPHLYGVYEDTAGKMWMVMDIIPGDWLYESVERISVNTVKDLIEIDKRLKSEKFGVHDFQYFITPDGHVVVFDTKILPMQKKAGLDSLFTEIKGVWKYASEEELGKITEYLKSEESGYFEVFSRMFPELFRQIDKSPALFPSLSRDIAVLEARLQKSGLGRLPRIGIHGEQAGHFWEGDIWYFIVDPQLQDYWRGEWRGNDLKAKLDMRKNILSINEVFMTPEEFFERLRGSVIFTADYTRFDLKNGVLPEIFLLVNDPEENFELTETSADKERAVVSAYNPESRKLADYRIFFVEGKQKADSIPITAKAARFAVTPEEAGEILQWAEAGGKSKLETKYFAYQLLYKKALNAMVSLAENPDGGNKTEGPEIQEIKKAEESGVFPWKGGQIVFNRALSLKDRESLIQYSGRILEFKNGNATIGLADEWAFINSLFEELENVFRGILGEKTLFQRIVDLAKIRGKEFVYVVDWGGGDGTAALGLNRRLQEAGIRNVRIIVFGDTLKGVDPGNIPENIIFIIDTAENLAEDIREHLPASGRVDLIYSYSGLSFLIEKETQGKMFIRHVNTLKKLLSPEGFIVTSVTNEHFLRCSPDDIAAGTGMAVSVDNRPAGKTVQSMVIYNRENAALPVSLDGGRSGSIPRSAGKTADGGDLWKQKVSLPAVQEDKKLAAKLGPLFDTRTARGLVTGNDVEAIDQACMFEAQRRGLPYLRLTLRDKSELDRLMARVRVTDGKHELLRGALPEIIERGGILFIDYSGSSPQFTEQFNSLYDRTPYFESIAASPELRVIGRVDEEAFFDSDSTFLSRFKDIIPLEGAGGTYSDPTEEITAPPHGSSPRAVEMFDYPYFLEELVGTYYLDQSGEIRVKEGSLLEAIRGKEPLLIKGDIWENKDFLRFIRQLILQRKLEFNGETITLPQEGFTLYRQEMDPRDGVKDKRIVSIKESKFTDRPLWVINGYNADILFSRTQVTADKKIAQLSGLLEEGALRLRVSGDLPDWVWHKIMHAPGTIEIEMEPGFYVPSLYGALRTEASKKETAEQKNADWEKAKEEKVILVEGDDLGYIREQLREDLGKETVFYPLTHDTNIEQLIDAHEIAFEGEKRVFTSIEKGVMSALRQGKTVVLEGADANPELLGRLATALSEKPYIMENGERIDLSGLPGKLIITMRYDTGIYVPSANRVEMRPGESLVGDLLQKRFPAEFNADDYQRIRVLEQMFFDIPAPKVQGLYPARSDFSFDRLSLLYTHYRKSRNWLEAFKDVIIADYENDPEVAAYLKVMARFIFSTEKPGYKPHTIDGRRVQEILEDMPVSGGGIPFYWELADALSLDLLETVMSGGKGKYGVYSQELFSVIGKALVKHHRGLKPSYYRHKFKVPEGEIIGAADVEYTLPREQEQWQQKIDHIVRLFWDYKFRALFFRGPPGTGKSHVTTEIGSLLGFSPAEIVGPVTVGSDSNLARATGKSTYRDSVGTVWEEGFAGEWIPEGEFQGGPPKRAKRLLIIDEANLTKPYFWDFLKAFFNPDPAQRYIWVNGQRRWFVEGDRIIFTGNDETVAGRQFEELLRESVVTVNFGKFDEGFLRGRLQEYISPDKENRPALIEVMLSLHRLFSSFDPALDFSLRDIQEFAARVNLSISGKGDIEQVAMIAWDIYAHNFSLNEQIALEQVIFRRFGVAISEVEKKTVSPIMKNKDEIYRRSRIVMVESAAAMAVSIGKFLGIRQARLDGASVLQGKRALVFEGPSGRGKDVIILEMLRNLGFVDAKEAAPDTPADRKFYRINASARVEEMSAAIKKSKDEGAIVLISEMNLLPTAFIEGQLNDLLTGSAHAGFALFVTINSTDYGGRQRFSSPLQNRMIYQRISDYTQSELREIARYENLSVGMGRILSDDDLRYAAGAHAWIRGHIARPNQRPTIREFLNALQLSASAEKPLNIEDAVNKVYGVFYLRLIEEHTGSSLPLRKDLLVFEESDPVNDLEVMRSLSGYLSGHPVEVQEAGMQQDAYYDAEKHTMFVNVQDAPLKRLRGVERESGKARFTRVIPGMTPESTEPLYDLYSWLETRRREHAMQSSYPFTAFETVQMENDFAAAVIMLDVNYILQMSALDIFKYLLSAYARGMITSQDVEDLAEVIEGIHPVNPARRSLGYLAAAQEIYGLIPEYLGEDEIQFKQYVALSVLSKMKEDYAEMYFTLKLLEAPGEMREAGAPGVEKNAEGPAEPERGLRPRQSDIPQGKPFAAQDAPNKPEQIMELKNQLKNSLEKNRETAVQRARESVNRELAVMEEDLSKKGLVTLERFQEMREQLEEKSHPYSLVGLFEFLNDPEINARIEAVKEKINAAVKTLITERLEMMEAYLNKGGFGSPSSGDLDLMLKILTETYHPLSMARWLEFLNDAEVSQRAEDLKKDILETQERFKTLETLMRRLAEVLSDNLGGLLPFKDDKEGMGKGMGAPPWGMPSGSRIDFEDKPSAISRRYSSMIAQTPGSEAPRIEIVQVSQPAPVPVQLKHSEYIRNSFMSEVSLEQRKRLESALEDFLKAKLSVERVYGQEGALDVHRFFSGDPTAAFYRTGGIEEPAPKEIIIAGGIDLDEWNPVLTECFLYFLERFQVTVYVPPVSPDTEGEDLQSILSRAKQVPLEEVEKILLLQKRKEDHVYITAQEIQEKVEAVYLYGMFKKAARQLEKAGEPAVPEVKEELSLERQVQIAEDFLDVLGLYREAVIVDTVRSRLQLTLDLESVKNWSVLDSPELSNLTKLQDLEVFLPRYDDFSTGNLNFISRFKNLKRLIVRDFGAGPGTYEFFIDSGRKMVDMAYLNGLTELEFLELRMFVNNDATINFKPLDYLPKLKELKINFKYDEDGLWALLLTHPNKDLKVETPEKTITFFDISLSLLENAARSENWKELYLKKLVLPELKTQEAANIEEKLLKFENVRPDQFLIGKSDPLSPRPQEIEGWMRGQPPLAGYFKPMGELSGDMRKAVDESLRAAEENLARDLLRDKPGELSLDTRELLFDTANNLVDPQKAFDEVYAAFEMEGNLEKLQLVLLELSRMWLNSGVKGIVISLLRKSGMEISAIQSANDYRSSANRDGGNKNEAEGADSNDAALEKTVQEQATKGFSEESRRKVSGIDLRNLPIATQLLPAAGKFIPAALARPSIPLADLDKEWAGIQEMVSTGIIPSGEKIKEYVRSCCQKGDISADIEKVLACISDMLRLEEDYVVAAEPGFVQLLAVLDSDKSGQEMLAALSAVSFERARKN